MVHVILLEVVSKDMGEIYCTTENDLFSVRQTEKKTIKMSRV